MQSPLTPQRGRIESNPREYTHMGPQLCGELATILVDGCAGLTAHAAGSRCTPLKCNNTPFTESFRKYMDS